MKGKVKTMHFHLDPDALDMSEVRAMLSGQSEVALDRMIADCERIAEQGETRNRLQWDEMEDIRR